MPKNWPNKYLNIFWCPGVDRTNIRIYWDTQELTEWIFKFMRTVEKPWLLINNIYAGLFSRIIYHQNFCIITKKKSKHIKLVKNYQKMVKSDQHMVKLYMKWVQIKKNDFPLCLRIQENNDYISNFRSPPEYNAK